MEHDIEAVLEVALVLLVDLVILFVAPQDEAGRRVETVLREELTVVIEFTLEGLV